MDVSIIIVSWNTRDDLRAAVDSCFRYSDGLDSEVIVVDNGSTDGSVEMLCADFPEVNVISNERNLGYTVACNQGMAHGSGRYYLMLNSDAALTAGCLRELVTFMDLHPDIASASPRLQFPDGSRQYAAGIFPRLSVHILPAATIRKIELAATDRFERPAESYDVDYVFGACNIVRATVVAEVGPMDERIFMWYDDADWQKRMADAGYRRVIFTNALCTHKVGTSYQALSAIRRNLRNSMSEFAYFRIHHGKLATLLLWSVRFIYSLAKTLFFGTAWLLTLGRNSRVSAAFRLARARLRFHVKYAANILWREPQPYRADDVT
jgi:GT2 family glycosyltransferase